MLGKISYHLTEGADKCGCTFFEMQLHLEATSERHFLMSTSSRTKISRERRSLIASIKNQELQPLC